MIRSQFASVPIWRFELLSRFEGLCHGVTARPGGVSEGGYAGLNLGLHVGDDPARVIENRRRAARALGLDFERCTFAQQVHGDVVRMVGERNAGAGGTRFEDGLPETDALAVRRPGVAVAVVVADCVPMLLYDPANHVGAAVHAGWRGTAAGIAGKAVELLAQQCESRPAELIAGVGPAIGGCCYQLSAQVVEQLLPRLDDKESAVDQRDETWHADLAEANRQQLLAAGLCPEHIELSGICTSCRSQEFYSERRLGRPTGRFAAFLSLTAR